MRLQNRRVLGAGVLALGAALVLAGCGAGQITQTDSQQPAVNGTYAQVGALVLRDASLRFPADGQAYGVHSNAPIAVTVVNQGAKDDELLSVTSDAATGNATIEGSKVVVASHSLVIGPLDAVEATGEAPVVSATPTSSAPSSSESSKPTGTSSSSSGSPSATTSVPTSSSAALPEKVGEAKVVLQDLTRQVWPGQTIKVTFVFRDAGPITFELPVGAPSRGRTSDVHTEAGAAGEGH
ncbi:hypothetical protein [Amycolatopsis sp. H20-H5]|uniref:hypothetical protein n=1 Tax=Amycolatopsis sp. H20-H5 TaxID=3046309 RepID=UPI002DBBAE8D|nr:hypothetical protein [Amycolatopsis sp. H20-H5]MEC3982472.1 hypothetical protein [Amycolatopsis sp. H20-H5]